MVMDSGITSSLLLDPGMGICATCCATAKLEPAKKVAIVVFNKEDVGLDLILCFFFIKIPYWQQAKGLIKLARVSRVTASACQITTLVCSVQ